MVTSRASAPASWPGTSTVSWPPQALRAAHYDRLAGERALAALAPDEPGWFSQAIEALQPVRDEVEWVRSMVGLGEAQTQAGIPAGRQTLLDAALMARQLGEFDLLVLALPSPATAACSPGTDMSTPSWWGYSRTHWRCVPAVRTRARLLSRLAAELTFHPDPARRRAIADEAVATAQASRDGSALLDALTRPDTALMIPELSELRLSRLQEAQRWPTTLMTRPPSSGPPTSLPWHFSSAPIPTAWTKSLGRAEEIARKSANPLCSSLSPPLAVVRPCWAGN